MIAVRRLLAPSTGFLRLHPRLCTPAGLHTYSDVLRLTPVRQSALCGRRHLCTEKPASEQNKAEETPKAEAEAEAESAEATVEEEVDELTALQNKIEELQEQVKAKHELSLRTMADLENTRKRALIDVDNAKKFAVSSFAKSLMEVADTLGYAAAAVPEAERESNPQLKALFDGVTMTDTILLKAFSDHGLNRINPVGEKFDPNLHSALFEVPDPEGEPGTVHTVTKVGYVLHDRCIRAAEVGVVKAP